MPQGATGPLCRIDVGALQGMLEGGIGVRKQEHMLTYIYGRMSKLL